jgi:RimJ/RimL family protein N-acetyltransferase
VVRTARLALRCWNPHDAPHFLRVFEESREHLANLPWSAQVGSLDAQVLRFRQSRASFDLGEDFNYAILDRDQTSLLGGAGLAARVGNGGREIGYWVHAHHLKQGIATEAAAALTRVAFEIEGLDRVEIHCGPKNVASFRVAEKLGFRHEATLRRRMIVSGREPRDTMVWALFADEYAKSAAGSYAIEAWDAAGRKLLG